MQHREISECYLCLTEGYWCFIKDVSGREKSLLLIYSVRETIHCLEGLRYEYTFPQAYNFTMSKLFEDVNRVVTQAC